MLIDGEKYACEACVRGHRVSSCQHADRPLQHINKKGRPVSQCPHCRGLRKSRATHAACECGSKPHNQEDHAESAGGKPELVDKSECCCTHGLRCTCALKKEHLDPVPEMSPSIPEMSPPAIPGPIRRTPSNKKPRLAKSGSDNSLSAFATPDTRPGHRRNESAHQLGMPYKVPIPHSVPGKSVARRSTDSLPLLKRKGSTLGSPHAGATSAPLRTRISKSEQGSPGPLEFNFFENVPQFDFSPTFYSPQEETSAMSGLSNMPHPTDWPAFDTPLDDYASYHQQTDPYQAFGQQPLAASSSGEVSDISDYLSQPGSRPQLSAANSDDSNIKSMSPATYPSMPSNVPSFPSDENLNHRLPASSIQSIAQNRPHNLSSDESLVSRLSPSSIHNVARNRPHCFSSDESVASRLSQRSLPTMSHESSPVGQPFKPPPVTEAPEETYLPPTSSPKCAQAEQFSPSPFSHINPSGSSSSSLRPPRSSPKQPQEMFTPRYNVLQPLQEQPRFHPTEVTPAEFSRASFSLPQSSHQEHRSQPTEVTPAEFSQASLLQTPHQPSQYHSKELWSAGFSEANLPQDSQERQQLHPSELIPAEFSQAPSKSPNFRPARRRSLSVQEAHRLAHPKGFLESKDQPKSPAIGGNPEEFTKHILSVRDAQRLAHPEGSDSVRAGQDSQMMAHSETPSEASSGSPSAGSEMRSDVFRNQGLTVQDAQRLAHPLTPTEAMSGLTIPQTTNQPADQQEKSIWAGGRAGSPTDSATSYVSQQEVEGTIPWRSS